MKWKEFKKAVDKRVKDDTELEFIDVSFFTNKTIIETSKGPSGTKIYNGIEEEK